MNTKRGCRFLRQSRFLLVCIGLMQIFTLCGFRRLTKGMDAELFAIEERGLRLYIMTDDRRFILDNLDAIIA